MSKYDGRTLIAEIKRAEKEIIRRGEHCSKLIAENEKLKTERTLGVAIYNMAQSDNKKLRECLSEVNNKLICPHQIKTHDLLIGQCHQAMTIIRLCLKENSLKDDK